MALRFNLENKVTEAETHALPSIGPSSAQAQGCISIQNWAQLGLKPGYLTKSLPPGEAGAGGWVSRKGKERISTKVW